VETLKKKVTDISTTTKPPSLNFQLFSDKVRRP